MQRDIYFVNVRNDHGAAYEWDPAHPGGSASYTDFRQLVRLSGFKTCEMGEVDLGSENVYIFAPNNGNVEAFLRQPRKAVAIHWELERPGIEWFPWFDETWVSDKTQEFMANHPRVRYVTLGGHKDLGQAPALQKLWDLCPLAYAYGSRLEKLVRLSEQGFTIAPATFEPEERNTILAHSRYGLMLHQSPFPIMTPLRAVLFACWKLPIIAEHVSDTHPYTFIAYDPTLAVLKVLEEEEIVAITEHNYNIVTETLTFKDCVERALDP